MITISEMTEFVAQDKRQFVFGLYLVEQTLGNYDETARQGHRIGDIRVVDLNAKLVGRITPVERQAINQYLRLVKAVVVWRDSNEIVGQPVLEQRHLFLYRNEIQRNFNEKNQRQSAMSAKIAVKPTIRVPASTSGCVSDTLMPSRGWRGTNLTACAQTLRRI